VHLFGWGISTIIVLIVAGIVLWMFIKSMLKVVALVVLLFAVGIFIVGYLIFTDAGQFANDFSQKESLFLFDSDGYIFAGGRVTGGNVSVKNMLDVALNGAELTEINLAYIKKDYAQIPTDGRIFVFKESAFDMLPNNIEITFPDGEKYILARDFAIGMIKSKDPIGLYAEDAIRRQTATGDAATEIRDRNRNQYADQDQFKGIVFMALVAELLQTPGYNIFLEYRNGTVLVIPETISFKAMKVFPLGMIKYLSKSRVV
jgi:hypothetical protein